LKARAPRPTRERPGYADPDAAMSSLPRARLRREALHGRPATIPTAALVDATMQRR